MIGPCPTDRYLRRGAGVPGNSGMEGFASVTAPESTESAGAEDARPSAHWNGGLARLSQMSYF